jgi:hypothetical protein
MRKFDDKQIKLFKEIYEFVDEEPDAISGVPEYAGILTVYQQNSALSIPHLVDSNQLHYDEDVNEILYDCWNEICETLNVDPKYRFKNLKEFIEKCAEYFNFTRKLSIYESSNISLALV